MGSRRPAMTLLGIGVATALTAAACSDSAGSSSSANAAPSGSSSGDGTIRQPTQAELDAAGFGDLPLAPESERVDIAEPVFSDPTNITNPLFPISELESVVFSGTVEGKPFHTETTLLSQTRSIQWGDGHQVEARISQYFAYLDGRIEEVALDYYAQAEDGSVWYLGEDVYDYNEDGFNDSTEGTWLAGPDGPVTMIMPGDPQAGDVFRAENVPPIAFEEVTVKSIDETVDGPMGPVEGALIGEELHLDATTSDKVFAPGYGEFFSDHDGDLEAMALAVPINALDGAVPAALESLSARADDLFAAVQAEDWDAASATLTDANTAWDDYQSGDTPPLLADEMTAALDASSVAIEARDLWAAGNAAIDVAQSALDLELQYRPVAEIDIARFEQWTRQILTDAAAANLGGVRGDVTTLEWIRDRFAESIPSTDLIEIDVALMELRNTVNDADLGATTAEAESLLEAVDGLQPTS